MSSIGTLIKGALGMRNLTRWSKTTLVASVTALGLSAASLSDAAPQSQSVSPTGSAAKAAQAKKSAIVPVRVVARQVKDQLVPNGRWTILGTSRRQIDSPLFRFPFFGYFAAAVAVFELGKHSHR